MKKKKITPDERKAIYFAFFDQYPEPFKTQARANYFAEYASASAVPESKSMALFRGFAWAIAPELHGYWLNFHAQLWGAEG
jgi:hypothetical protein